MFLAHGIIEKMPENRFYSDDFPVKSQIIYCVNLPNVLPEIWVDLNVLKERWPDVCTYAQVSTAYYQH